MAEKTTRTARKEPIYIYFLNYPFEFVVVVGPFPEYESKSLVEVFHLPLERKIIKTTFPIHPLRMPIAYNML
jgi:hypothetical protein